jgi:DUF2075 family protein
MFLPSRVLHEWGSITQLQRSWSEVSQQGKENNPRLGIVYADEDLLEYVVNIYRVLLTRGIKGTYIYVVDPGLRDYLKRTLSEVS